MKFFLLITTTIATISAGFFEHAEIPMQRNIIDAPSTRITNGKNASQGQFPYQVSLYFDVNRFCSGSIINEEWILTAAHCTRGTNQVYIGFGSTELNQPEFYLTVPSANFVQHARYNPFLLSNDISLIRITPPINFANFNNINKIALPAIENSGMYDTYVAENVIASGWGYKSDAATTISRNLQFATFKVISEADCQNIYGAAVTSNNICIETSNKTSTCHGDSGGPLILENEQKLIGIVSFGSSQGCESERATGFTRITSYLNWIREKSGVYYE